MAYKLIILAFIFAAGCVIGWGIEVLYRRFKKSNTEKVWINPGFLTGPYLPLYGFGLTLLYILASMEKYIHIGNSTVQKLVLFLIMAAAMTLTELIAGEIFIIRMHIKLWDYTDNKLNFKGIIGLRFSFYWAVLGAVYYFLIHPHILDMLYWFSHNLLFSFVIGFFYGIFFIDLCYSFKAVEKIRKFAAENEMIIRYEELKKHIKRTAKIRKERYRFMLAFHTETSISEHLKQYLIAQREQQRSNKINDFIKKKIKKRN